MKIPHLFNKATVMPTTVAMSNALVAYAEIRLSVAALGDDWLLVAMTTLCGGEGSTSSLRFELEESPLTLIRARCDRGELTTTTPEYEAGAEQSILRRTATPGGWDGARLDMTFRWSPRQRASSRLLSIPDALPRLSLLGQGQSQNASVALPRVILEHELVATLFAGGVACPDDSGQPSGKFLQSVIVSAMDGDPGMVALDELLVLADGVDPTREMADAAVEYVLPLLTFLREELGSADLIRPVMHVARIPADETTAPRGAYSPVEPEQTGATLRGGKPMSVLRLFSFAWFDGGIRLYGPNASDLLLALGGAYGLYWLHATGRSSELAAALRSQTAAVVAARASDSWSLQNRVQRIQLSLFEGLRDARVRKGVRDFLRTHWGQWVSQDDCIAMLRERGAIISIDDT